MSFDLQPVLEGETILLRPLTEDDFDDLYAAASDPLIWEQHPEPDRYTLEGFTRVFRGAMESKGALVVIDREAGGIIGSSRYHGYSEAADEVEIGWSFLARSHWGGTTNREMKRLMLAHAFRFVRNVVFVIGPNNLRSQRAIEKIGAKLIGRRPDGAGRDSLLFLIKKEEATANSD